MILLSLLKSLPTETRLNASLELRHVLQSQGRHYAEHQLTGLPTPAACYLVRAMGFQDREARLIAGTTIEALNSISGTFTPLFTLA
jgi:hypothetical protein